MLGGGGGGGGAGRAVGVATGDGGGAALGEGKGDEAGGLGDGVDAGVGEGFCVDEGVELSPAGATATRLCVGDGVVRWTDCGPAAIAAMTIAISAKGATKADM